MKIQIDIDKDTPLFSQVIDQIKQLVSSGALLPDAALPSIRQLANDLEINHKTIAKAYRLLERDHIIKTKGYRGTFIHPNAQENCTVNLQAWVLSELTKSIQTFRHAKVTDSEIRIAFVEVMNTHETQGQ